MSKTSQLNELTTAPTGPAETDLVQIVDVSDNTTMTGGAGTNKKITLGNLATGLITFGGVQGNIPVAAADQYYAGTKTWKKLDKAAVGLSAVTNESKQTMFTNPIFTGLVNLPITTSIGNVSSDELAHLNSVTSPIQTQLDSKQPLITGAAITIATNLLTANAVLVSTASGNVAASSITAAELGYLDTVTSNIQTQLDSFRYSAFPVSTSTLTLGLIHVNKYIQCSHVTQTNVTINSQTAVNWSIDSIVYFRRLSGAGPIYITTSPEVIVNGKSFAPTVLENQNFALKRVGLNTWDLI